MERIHCAEKKHTGCAERKRTLKRRLPNWRALKYITAKLLFLLKNRRSDGLPLCFQGIKITRCLWGAWLAAGSDRFWFQTETMRGLTCFAIWSFQWNKDFAITHTAETSVEPPLTDWFYRIINPTSYCSASLQWSFYWITLLNWLCAIMSTRYYTGRADRKRTLKRRLPDWMAL